MDIMKDNKIIMQGNKNNGLYMFDISETDNILLASNTPKNTTEKLQRAHSKLGHRNLLQIKKYIKNKHIKLNGFPINATDDIGMRLPPNKPAFTFPSPNSDMKIQVFLRKMTPSKGQPKGMMAFNYQFEDK